MTKQAFLMQDFSEPLIANGHGYFQVYGVSQAYMIKELFIQGISLRNGIA